MESQPLHPRHASPSRSAGLGASTGPGRELAASCGPCVPQACDTPLLCAVGPTARGQGVCPGGVEGSGGRGRRGGVWVSARSHALPRQTQWPQGRRTCNQAPAVWSGGPRSAGPLTRAPQPNDQEEGRFGTQKTPSQSPSGPMSPLPSPEPLGLDGSPGPCFLCPRPSSKSRDRPGSPGGPRHKLPPTALSQPAARDPD